MNDFELEDPIGFGSFSTVYKARRIKNCNTIEMSQFVAIKITKIESDSEKSLESKCMAYNRKKIENEIELWKPLDHKNVCKLIDWFFIEENQEKIVFVMEYAENGDLLSFLSDLNSVPTIKTVKNYFKQLCEAVQYLHSRDLIHGDIKLENVLLCGQTVKLGDFGLAKRSCEALGEFGTVEYAAPELITRNVEVDPFKADMWALGVVLYTLMYREFPFDGPSVKSIKNQILNNDVNFDCDGNVYEDKRLLLNVLKMLLEKNPEMRPSPQEILKSSLFEFEF